MPESSKKSETIEVRVPWRLKQEFMARTRRENQSASEVIRNLMEAHLQRHTSGRRWGAALGVAGLAALVAVAIPAGAAPDLRAQFKQLDRNGDGLASLEEMAPLPREALADFDIVGPILLPVVSASGERQVMMLHMARPRGSAYPDPQTPTPVLRGEFAGGDRSGDGSLSFAEFRAHYDVVRTRSFGILDRDGDGVLTHAEIGSNPIDGPGGNQAAEVLRSLDADGDGNVTRHEYQQVVCTGTAWRWSSDRAQCAR